MKKSACPLKNSLHVGLHVGNSGNSERLFFLTSKIPADGDCNHEIKRNLLLGRKAMINLVMYGYESWTIKKAEH